MTATPDLLGVDWSSLPRPLDDAAADHLRGLPLPRISLLATGGSPVCLADLAGRTVVYAYPKTGRPGVALPPNWDLIPGARGCTPQSCAFRDHYSELKDAGAGQVFGLSVQDTEYQREVVERLHLPFQLLSDANLELTKALRLPVIELETAAPSETLTQRLTMIIDNGRIVHVFYPVFPPDENAAGVLSWLKANR